MHNSDLLGLVLLLRVHRNKTIKWLFSYIFDYFFQNDIFVSGAPSNNKMIFFHIILPIIRMFVLGADKGGSCPALSCSGLLLSQSKILPFMNIFSADSNSIKTLFIYFWLFFSEWCVRIRCWLGLLFKRQGKTKHCSSIKLFSAESNQQ